MQSQYNNETIPSRVNQITIDRPDSSQLVDLHVYLIPKQIWKDRQNLVENEAMSQAISVGFVHIPPNMTIKELRRQIVTVCGQDNRFPRNFTYLRSVGRCLTKVKPQQETDLKVKNYRPPLHFAAEIYIIEEENEDENRLNSGDSDTNLFRESPIRRPVLNSPKSTANHYQHAPKPNTDLTAMTAAPLVTSAYQREESATLKKQSAGTISTLSRASSTLSARDLAKLREEQERLRLRQLELERQRREIELEEEKRQKMISTEQREKQELAATRIQATYRGYQTRRNLKELKQREIAATEIERLQNEARQLTRRKAEEEQVEEIEAKELAKLSDLLENLKTKRTELEAAREAIVRQMQHLHGQITIRRKEERDTWKQKYLFEKKKTIALEERGQSVSLDRNDVKTQLDQVKLELKNSVKLRQQAENECQLLKREIQLLRSSMNTADPNQLMSLPSEQTVQQQSQQPVLKSNLPILLDITLQY